MPANPKEIAKRETAAKAAIMKTFDASDEESDVALFISHHLEELDSGYWTEHFSNKTPPALRILESLVLRDHWGGDDEMETFDFALPGDVTDYVISVSFDEAGDVVGITMES